MTLTQINYLIAVGKTRSISKAAGNLFVSRQSIASALRKLEDEFSVPLFYRTSAGLMLTHEGRFFFERAIEIQRLSGDLSSFMCSLRKKQTASVVSIGITPTTSLLVFPKLFKYVRSKLPEVNIITKEYSRVHSHAMLKEGQLDFHLSADRSTADNIERLVFFKTQLALCVPFWHKLAKREYVSADDIKDEPLIYLTKHFHHEEYIELLFMNSGYEPDIRFRSLQISTIRELVANGIGSAVLMQGAIDDGKRIIGVPFYPPAIPAVVNLSWNVKVRHSAAFYSFLNCVREFKDTMNW